MHYCKRQTIGEGQNPPAQPQKSVESNTMHFLLRQRLNPEGLGGLYCKRIPLFLLPRHFLFPCQACFVDCFSSAFCSFYLSVCLLSLSPSFFTPASPHSPSFSWHSLVCQAIIELPLFDQRINDGNCNPQTQLFWSARVHAHVRALVLAST